MRRSYTLEARLEVMEIATWYFEQQRALAADFDRELKVAEKDIIKFPENCGSLGHGYRRYLLKRFPYSLVYRIEIDELVVVAVAAHKRGKNYWQLVRER